LTGGDQTHEETRGPGKLTECLNLGVKRKAKAEPVSHKEVERGKKVGGRG